ncbi:MAG: 23S rRNA (adenine(2503)-C(2))-methyltransferase RlmN [Elusimicrobia bacterium]|nr:23S rRNA (adenine(2503)-C(2))-methyltransferase RlmN [Elusimicrobiota bacterium]
MDWEKALLTLKARKADPYRGRQLARAVFQGAAASYAEVKVLPADLRQALEAEVPLLSSSEAAVARSEDGTVKTLLDLAGGGQVETVLMRPSPLRWTACISTQTGCAIGCSFCATGKTGPGRSLTPEEITDQVLYWRQFLRREAPGERLGNIVYMGMGEPFLDYEGFAASLRILLDQGLFGIGARHISVSTAGLVPQMERFAADFPQVNLAVSLHAANDGLRDRLVPINRKYPLAVLAGTLKTVFTLHQRKVFLEYVVLEGENDSAKDAADLAAFVRSVDAGLLHVNLLAHNPGVPSPKGSSSAPAQGSLAEPPRSAPPADPETRRFQGYLKELGIICTVRQSFGRDIDAACGQLAARSRAIDKEKE